MAPGELAMYKLVEDVSELLFVVESVTSSHPGHPQVLKSVEQCAPSPLLPCTYLEVFLNKVKEADQAVPRSPNVIEKTHILLQRAIKRMQKMQGQWDNFTSWQAVSEVRGRHVQAHLRSTKKQLRLYSKTLQLSSGDSPRSPAGTSPLDLPSLLTGSDSAPASTSTRRTPPTPVSVSHNNSSINSGMSHRGTYRPPASAVLNAESPHICPPSVNSQRAQHIEFAQRQKMEGRAATQRVQRAQQDSPQGRASTQPIMRSADSQASCRTAHACAEKDQFEDPRSHAISQAAIAEIGARMAAQEAGWLQSMNDPQSPRSTQRERDEDCANPLCVLPSTYHAMTPPTSVSTTMVSQHHTHPHSIAGSIPEIPNPFVGANCTGVGSARPLLGLMGGLNGPVPRPSASPHFSPPKPPSITAAERYAAPRPPPPPHPPTTVGSNTSERSVNTCTSLAGAGTSDCVFTILDSQRTHVSRHTPNPSAAGHFPDPTELGTSAHNTSGSSPGVMLPQIPSTAHTRGHIPVYSAAPSAKPTGAAAAAAAGRAALAAAAPEDQAQPLPLLHRHALHTRDPSMRSVASIPSSVSSVWGQSAPQLCSSPRGVEDKFLFASPSTRGKLHSEKKKALQQKVQVVYNHGGPLQPVTVMSSGRPASQTMGELKDTPVAEIMNSVDSTTMAAAMGAVGAQRARSQRPCSRGSVEREQITGSAGVVDSRQRSGAGAYELPGAPSEKGSTLSVYSTPAPPSAPRNKAVPAQGSAAAAAADQAAAARVAAASRVADTAAAVAAAAGLGAAGAARVFRELKRKVGDQQQHNDSAALSHSTGGATTSCTLHLTGCLQQTSDQLKAARQTYGIPDGTMPSVPAAQRLVSREVGIQVSESPLGAPGCMEQGSGVLFMPATASSYHPSSYGGMAFDLSQGNCVSDLETAGHTSEHGQGLSSCTDIEDVFRSLEFAVSSVTANSTTPSDSRPETMYTSSHMHAAHAHNDLERTPSPETQRTAQARKRCGHSKPQSKPKNKPSGTNSKPKAGKSQLQSFNDMPERSTLLLQTARTSPDSQRSFPPAPSRQASTVSSGSKVAAYRYQPLPKSSQKKKLPTRKQITIVEDLSSKLAAAVSGESELDTPSSTAGASNDHRKCAGVEAATAKHTAQRAAQHEDDASPRATPRCFFFTFLCGNCGKPPVDTA